MSGYDERERERERPLFEAFGKSASILKCEEVERRLKKMCASSGKAGKQRRLRERERRLHHLRAEEEGPAPTDSLFDEGSSFGQLV